LIKHQQGELTLRINYNELSTNNIINNQLKNANLHTTRKQPQHTISATVNISEDAINKYFDEGIFDDISNNIESKERYITDGTIDKYGKKYAEVYKNIMENAPESKRTAYLEKLDSAFQEAIGDESNRIINKIENFLSDSKIESSLDKESFKEFFSKIANAAKDYYIDGSTKQLDDYINDKIGDNKLWDFKTYGAFTKTIDIIDYTEQIRDEMKSLKDFLIGNSANDIISSNDMMDRIRSYADKLNQDIDKLNELKESIDPDEINSKFGKELIESIEKKTSQLNDINGKMQKYTELLERYKKIQGKIDKAKAKRESLNQKMDKANQTKNQDLVTTYLKRIQSADANVATLEAESAQIQSELATLLKDIKESKI
jgi:hypothetical protein